MATLVEVIATIWAFIIDVGQSLFEPKKYTFSKSSLVLHNTLSGTDEVFKPAGRAVTMYHCGPTVYGVQHIGNLSMFVFTDILRRTLEYVGYPVRQVINITDVGHLVSDGDDGEDKMTKGLKRDGLEPTLENMRVLAEKYTAIFLEDIKRLNAKLDDTKFPRASAYIEEQIAMVKTLEEKGYAYPGKSGVYYDTSHFPAYGALGNINLEGLKEGARVATSSEKKNFTDFLLWKFDAKTGWDSPWGKGFPGWHIECSAMIRALLGNTIDIHTGGIEHIPVHHNNEIAQSEAATDEKPFVRFWLHRAHLQLEGGKMAKSEGNVVYLSDIVEKGFHPLSFRYLLLGAHYRQSASFSWDALKAAQTALLKLRRLVDTLPEGGSVPEDYKRRFTEKIANDLDTPNALAVLWEMTKDTSLAPKNLRAGLLDFDKVLGLGLAQEDANARALWEKEFGVVMEESNVPQKIRELIARRETARTEKNWKGADSARNEIEAAGYVIEDTANGPRVVKK